MAGSGKYLVLTALLLMVLAPGASAAGSRDVDAVRSSTAAPRAATKVTAVELAAMLAHKDFVLVNVHVPYQGDIPGTDLSIRYDRVAADQRRLPAEKTTPIVVYCRSGAMSAIAAQTLRGLGYTNVRDVTGGMVAWEDAGFHLVRRSR